MNSQNINTPKLCENTPLLETQRLILRRCETLDAPAFLELLSDEEVNRFLPWFPTKTLEEAIEHIEKNFIAYYQHSSAYRYAVCLKKDNIPVGYVCLGEGDSYDFGYGLKKELWGKGIITEAAKAVIERLKNAGYTYITATHDINNPASGEVMKKLGMTYRYSYIEQCQPKNITVTFKMYQLNFDGNEAREYSKYWDKYPNHFRA